MQLKLGFPDLADPTIPLWDALDPEAREALLQALARAIAQAALHPEKNQNQEDRDDR